MRGRAGGTSVWVDLSRNGTKPSAERSGSSGRPSPDFITFKPLWKTILDFNLTASGWSKPHSGSEVSVQNLRETFRPCSESNKKPPRSGCIALLKLHKPSRPQTSCSSSPAGSLFLTRLDKNWAVVFSWDVNHFTIINSWTAIPAPGLTQWVSVKVDDKVIHVSN